jgi:hypothetical protein
VAGLLALMDTADALLAVAPVNLQTLRSFRGAFGPSRVGCLQDVEVTMTEDSTPKPSENVRVKSGSADRTSDGFGQGEGYSGDEYDSSDHAAERHLQNRDGAPKAGDGEPAYGRDIPPEAGKRAYIDNKTGEVHGSGSSAGGGNPGEDIDLDTSRSGPKE